MRRQTILIILAAFGVFALILAILVIPQLGGDRSLSVTLTAQKHAADLFSTQQAGTPPTSIAVAPTGSLVPFDATNFPATATAAQQTFAANFIGGQTLTARAFFDVFTQQAKSTALAATSQGTNPAVQTANAGLYKLQTEVASTSVAQETQAAIVIFLTQTAAAAPTAAPPEISPIALTQTALAPLNNRLTATQAALDDTATNDHVSTLIALTDSARPTLPTTPTLTPAPIDFVVQTRIAEVAIQTALAQNAVNASAGSFQTAIAERLTQTAAAIPTLTPMPISPPEQTQTVAAPFTSRETATAAAVSDAATNAAVSTIFAQTQAALPTLTPSPTLNPPELTQTQDAAVSTALAGTATGDANAALNTLVAAHVTQTASMLATPTPTPTPTPISAPQITQTAAAQFSGYLTQTSDAAITATAAAQVQSTIGSQLDAYKTATANAVRATMVGSFEPLDASTISSIKTIATLSGAKSAITGLAFDGLGTRLAVSSLDHDRAATVWDMRVGGDPLAIFSAFSNWSAVAFSADDQRIAVGGEDKTLRVLTLATGDETVFKGHTNPISGVAFSPDGRLIATSSADGQIGIWNVTAGTVAFLKVPGGSAALSGVAFSPNGRIVISGSVDGTVKVWETNAGILLKTLITGHPVTSIAYSPTGALIAATFVDGSMRLWDAKSYKLLAVFPVKNATQSAVSVAFNPAGTLVAVGAADAAIRIYDPKGLTLVTTLSTTAPVTSVAFSPDGARLVSGGGDGVVTIWAVAKPGG